MATETGGHVDAVLASLQTDELSADAVFDSLRGAILDRRLAPGQRLTEDDLARAFGVSRTPIREVLLRLQAESLVEKLGRRGLIVTRISPREVIEIYDVRRGLDGLAAELAAANAAPPDIAQLKWVNDRMRLAATAGDPQEIGSLNFEFHEWMSRASGNGYLLQKVREVQNRVRRFERSTLDTPGRRQRAIEEHEAIIQAIESGDAAAARAAAEVHMANARVIRLRMLEDADA